MALDPALKAQLAGMKGAFKRAKENPDTYKDSGYATYDDGKYRMALTGAAVGHSQAGRFQISWDWNFLEGKYAGKTKQDYDGLDDPEKIPYVLRKIRKFGIDISQLEPEEIPEALDAIVAMKPIADVTLRTPANKDFQNFYLNSVEVAWSASAETEAEAQPSGSEPSASGAASETAAEGPAFKIGDRVRFQVGEDYKVGIIRGINLENNQVTVRSGGKDYEMFEEDFVPAT